MRIFSYPDVLVGRYVDLAGRWQHQSDTETIGFSIGAHGEEPLDGYMVQTDWHTLELSAGEAAYAHRSTWARIDQWVRGAVGYCDNAPAGALPRYLGAWIDGAGILYCDVSERHDDLGQAIDALNAVGGLALYDVSDGRDIPFDATVHADCELCGLPMDWDHGDWLGHDGQRHAPQPGIRSWLA